MKRILYLACLCLAVGARAQAKVGQPAPEMAFATLLNPQQSQLPLSALRGKVVLLEFWATWCGPCLSQMPHLEALQEAYQDHLQIIAVTAESQERISSFLRNRPSSLWFAIDTSRTVQAQFPHKIIPHTVLLDASGIVRAITEPSQVTKKVIGQLVAGKTIAVPLKEDLQYTNPQLIADTYFAASAHTASRVLIQPEVPGAASYENRYANDSAFQNRRITFINIPLLDMYRLAHGDISRLRTISQRTGGESPSYLQKYCLDIIVDKGKEKTLLPRLAKELRDRFSIQGKREKQSQPVYVLQVADQSKAGQLTASSQGDGYLMAQADSFEGKELKINQLTQYLENFGILPLPVVDETGLKAVYNISLKFEPERKESLLMALHQIGLQLTESQREIEVLLLK